MDIIISFAGLKVQDGEEDITGTGRKVGVSDETPPQDDAVDVKVDQTPAGDEEDVVGDLADIPK